MMLHPLYHTEFTYIYIYTEYTIDTKEIDEKKYLSMPREK